MRRLDSAIVKKMEDAAWRDFADHRGRVLLATHVYGTDDHSNSVDLVFEPPLYVRVDDVTPLGSDIGHWVDEWLDPYWNVTPLEPHESLTGIHSTWVYGISYTAKTGEVQRSGWVKGGAPGHEACLLCLAHR